ncbi:MAG: hypothetical protein V3T17_15625 [Pseudomonadales bacterium]
MASKKPIPIQGSRGTPASRRMQRQLAEHIHRLTKDISLSEGAKLTSLKSTDIKNQRQGNMPSLTTLLRVVKKMRWTPESLLSKGKLKKLHGRTRTNDADLQKVRKRIQEICRKNDAQTLADATGIPISNIYQTRTQNAKVGLHTVLSMVHAGFSASALLLGTPKSAKLLPQAKSSPRAQAKKTKK